VNSNAISTAKIAPPGGLWLWAVRGLALAALLIAGYLTIVALNEGSRPAGCGPESACSRVLSSPWSRWLGVVPVSTAAVVLYALTIAATVFLGPNCTALERRRVWIMLMLAAVTIAGAAIWFTFLQAFVIKGWCPWCMGDHAFGIAVAVLILIRAPFGRNASTIQPSDGAIAPPAAVTIVAVALLAVGAVAVGQILVPAKMASDGAWVADGGQNATTPLVSLNSHRIDREKGIVWALHATVRVDLNEPLIPLIGPADAESVMLELFDYCCSHCRQIQARIKVAQARYGAQLAVAVMPVPLNSMCNRSIRRTRPEFAQSCDLARLAMAVWLADRDSFALMHEWLFVGETAPSAKDARARAEKLIGVEDLEVALADPGIGLRINSNMELHVRTYGKERKYTHLPKIILRGQRFTGVPSEEVFLRALETYHGVKPVEVE